jgi:penicillin-binding protein 1A
MTIFAAFRRAMLGLAAAGLLAIVGLALFIGYCAYTLPLSRPAGAEPAPAAVVYASTSGQPFTARGVYRGDKITADHLPQDLARAVVAIEDRRFYGHGGIDPRGIARAAWHNLIGHGGLEGGSTITQQLAHLAYLSPERTIHRKVQEAMVALWLESRLDKSEILARYLNEAYFGAGAYGADAAAKRYFGKKAAALTLAEAAMLAGLVRAPSQLAPNRHPQAAQRRADLVIQAMLDTGAIDAARAADARVHPATLAIPPEPEPGQNYFVDAAEAEIHRLVGSVPLDLNVTTTLDPQMQDAAERIVEQWLAGDGAKRNASEAALIAMAPNGAILAMVGGRDYRASQFNRAVQAHRQPGSLFKVIVYLTALSNGYTPDSTLVDQPVQIGNWSPQNFEGRYRGPVSLRVAFAHSINTISAQLVEAIGVSKVIEMAKSLGVQSELPAVPSLALGSAEVTLLEMTRAMDAIAINSKSVDAYMIRSIASQNAAPLYTRPETVRDPPVWNRAPMVQLLEAVVNEGTGHAAKLDRRAGGKTGTTQDYRDGWFVGFTADIVVGVWVGNDDNSPMDRVTGGDIPAKIWHDFVLQTERMRTQPAVPTTASPPQTAASAQATQPQPPPLAPPPTVTQTQTAPPPSPTMTQQIQAEPASSAVAQAASLPQPGTVVPSPTPGMPAGPLRGVPMIVDTATLVVQGETVHLSGVAGEKGDYMNNLARFIGGRDLLCVPVAANEAGEYQCFVGRQDLAVAIVLGGAGRTTADAAPMLRAAEQRARSQRRGVWER